MRFKTFVNLVAIILFIAYFAPVVLKLKEIPLALVVLAGFVLAAIEIRDVLRNGD